MGDKITVTIDRGRLAAMCFGAVEAVTLYDRLYGGRAGGEGTPIDMESRTYLAALEVITDAKPGAVRVMVREVIDKHDNPRAATDDLFHRLFLSE